MWCQGRQPAKPLRLRWQTVNCVIYNYSEYMFSIVIYLNYKTNRCLFYSGSLYYLRVQFSKLEQLFCDCECLEKGYKCYGHRTKRITNILYTYSLFICIWKASNRLNPAENKCYSKSSDQEILKGALSTFPAIINIYNETAGSKY